MARHNPVGRLDDIIDQLEKLHKDAHSIFDAYVDDLICPGMSFGVLKAHEIGRAGTTLDYIAALKMLREKITERSRPHPVKTMPAIQIECWLWDAIMNLAERPQTAH
jgi:hypothetical protein